MYSVAVGEAHGIEGSAKEGRDTAFIACEVNLQLYFFLIKKGTSLKSSTGC